MAGYDKPLPVADPVTKPFWDSLREHAIQLQWCGACERFIYYPRAVCPGCLSSTLEWRAVTGRGVVHAFTIPHRHPNPAFAAEAPYVVALVELEEGPRMLTNLVGVDPSPDAVRVGLPVAIEYDDVTEQVTLPRFRPR